MRIRFSIAETYIYLKILTTHTVRLKFAKINGLYTYNNKKNRIDFGEKTVIVGSNNTGKSSIFKALKYFLNSLVEFNAAAPGPWDWQNEHTMTIGLELNRIEARCIAEMLSSEMSDENDPLIDSRVCNWLTPKLKHITLTIRWNDARFPDIPVRIQYFLRLEKLKVTVWADEFNGDTSVVSMDVKKIRPSFDSSSNNIDNTETEEDDENELSENKIQPLFPNIVCDMLDGDRSNEEFYKLLENEGANVSRFPANITFFDQDAARNNTRKSEFLMTMSNDPQENRTCSFFVILGHMLMQRFEFISEKRSFMESNSFEKQPLKDDGSNLQSFLFWLQHSDRNTQAAFFAIQRAFNKVVGNENLLFSVSVIEDKDKINAQASERSANACRHRITIQFAERLEQKQKYTDFVSIGAGIKETLFLLAKCFERRDKVILMDEPATNLHPTMIRRLMDEIFASNDQESKSGQVVIITHSPSVASLEMLSSMNQIVRIDRIQYSIIVQPSQSDRNWITSHLSTFHLFKPEALFSKQIALVEGPSDKLFLDVLLKHYGSDMTRDDVLTVDVGSISSFPKFGRLLDIFQVPYIILADNSEKNLFEPSEVFTLDIQATSLANNKDKTVYCFQKDLEAFFDSLEQLLHQQIQSAYNTKPERAYHFAKKLIEKYGSNASKMTPARLLVNWVMEDHHNMVNKIQRPCKANT